ncbi:hypothetical protein GCM10009117_20440 [Gangjinia marincola]|uniref:Tetratricopeptide repeat protein n=1 Tax=Gangjinia marincola TaxID=578463 RepID=A0ABN1MI78_9FLAO
MEREELIERYFEQKLTVEEQAEFDALLKNDTAFSKEVDFRNDVKQAINLNKREEQKALLQGFEEELNNATTSQQSTTPKIWLVAASIVALIAVGIYGALQFSSQSPDELYLAYYEPYENVVKPIERGEVSEDAVTKAFAAYEMENYQFAIKQFDSLYTITNEGYYLLYQANAYMALDQYDQAIPLLEKHIALKDDFQPKSLWYLGLSYLKTERADMAKPLFELLVSNNGYKAAKSKEILEEL